MIVVSKYFYNDETPDNLIECAEYQIMYSKHIINEGFKILKGSIISYNNELYEVQDDYTITDTTTSDGTYFIKAQDGGSNNVDITITTEVPTFNNNKLVFADGECIGKLYKQNNKYRFEYYNISNIQESNLNLIMETKEVYQVLSAGNSQYNINITFSNNVYSIAYWYIYDASDENPMQHCIVRNITINNDVVTVLLDYRNTTSEDIKMLFVCGAVIWRA